MWLFTRFGFHPWDKVKENLEGKKYDAFVLYHIDDWPWICDTLMPKLKDEHGFKLYVHERDFELGLEIKDNIIKAINSSRRIIFIVTPEFVKSFWCSLEFLEATQKAFDERTNFLILALLKEIDDKDLEGKDRSILRLCMKTYTYAKVSDKWLWRKMLYAMTKVPLDQLKVQKNSQHDNNHLLDNQGPHNGGNDNDIKLDAAGGLGEDVPLLDVVLENSQNQNKNHGNDDVELLHGMEGPDDVPLLNVTIENNIMQGSLGDNNDVLVHDTEKIEGEDVPLLNM